jgi:hypothetical protein
MVLKLIACEVFYREVCLCVAASPHRVDIEFTEKNAHEKSEVLRDQVQTKIDAAEAGAIAYDAILLGFGLCGNGVLGVGAKKTPLVLPRAHDCCTIFLGSRIAFKEHFASNPSLPFSSVGYMERGTSWIHDASTVSVPGLNKSFEEYVAEYGEENARFIMETLTASNEAALSDSSDNRVVFVEVPELAHLGFAEKARREAERTGKRFVLIPGNMRLIRGLVDGAWSDEEYLVVPPGARIGGVYDWDRIVKVEERT